MLGLCWVEAIGWRQTGALAKVGIKGRAKWREAGLQRLCVSAGNGWSLGARGGARQAWLSRDVGEAWGGIAVAVLSKKIIIGCFSSCLERWQRGAGDSGEEKRGRWASCVCWRDGGALLVKEEKGIRNEPGGGSAAKGNSTFTMLRGGESPRTVGRRVSVNRAARAQILLSDAGLAVCCLLAAGPGDSQVGAGTQKKRSLCLRLGAAWQTAVRVSAGFAAVLAATFLPRHEQVVNLPDPGSKSTRRTDSRSPALSLGKARGRATTGKQICRPPEPAAGSEKSLFLPSCLLAWLQAQPGSRVGHPCARRQLSPRPCRRGGGDALAEEHRTVSAGERVQPATPLIFLFPVDAF
ncbi:uncharacterized protein LOC121232600 isoform X1 [Aquila chrysaetos chrysaetos]|uniref:uncharacterized protein LOC121232600 isoform X1 n=1 Tax=Aquila chrysaetos chrysaetos TaxID=223781 RepID=UPI001B7D3A36|nr:uncharacterized protein LOC121232600 isoform X1 [Aquila chrysaetos chrysaetos]